MRRRQLLQAGLATLAAPRIASAKASANVLKFIPESDLAVVDPIWTTATVTRNHGYLVFDTLYSQNDKYEIEPQMIEGHVIENDGLTWKLTLREGLKFHDGDPVRARDVIQSIKRFAARDAFGASLMAATNELSAVSDRVVQFRLKKRFPLLPNALGKSGTIMPAIMPEHLALTDPNKQVIEMIGSGPFRFLADERVSGALVAYARFEGYVPRKTGSPTFTAGPKIAHFDRIEWQVIPDVQTAANALQAAEVDWWQQPQEDQRRLLKRDQNLIIEVQDTAGGIGVLRFNHLFEPFSNPAMRRVVLHCISQHDCMTSIADDDKSAYKEAVGVFSPDTPLANDAGIAQVTAPRDLRAARRELEALGYNGEKIVLLAPTDQAATYAMALVAADAMQAVGFNVDLQTLDWGTVVQRRSNKKRPADGGWHIFFTFLNGTNNFDPASQLGIRGNGENAWFGWPTAPKLEALRAQWFEAPTLAEQQRICREIQMQFWEDLPYIPLGAYYSSTAYRRTITGVRIGFPQFYDVKPA